MFLGAMPDGSHGERSKNLMYHVSEFERGTVPKKGTRVTYVRGQYNRQPVARVIRVVEARKEHGAAGLRRLRHQT